MSDPISTDNAALFANSPLLSSGISETTAGITKGPAVSPIPIGPNPASFSERMSNAGAAANNHLGNAQTRGVCANCPFTIRLEHQSRYTATKRYSRQEWVAATDFIFLIGQERKLSVRVADPQGAVATWEVTPLGAHSGTVTVNSGTGNQFDYTPTVTRSQRPITASREPNPPVRYQIKATVTINGQTQEKVEIIAQDERDIIRQEYVDFRTWRSGFTLHVPYRNRIVEASRPALRGNYNLVLDSAMTELLTATERHLGETIQVSSGWRNPRRNLAAKSKVPNSNHQHGGAVDMKPSGAGVGATRRLAFLKLYNAARQAGGRMVLLEHNAQQIYPGNAPVPEPSARQPDTDSDGIPNAAMHGGATIQSKFDYATHVHIDRNPPDEAEDD